MRERPNQVLVGKTFGSLTILKKVGERIIGNEKYPRPIWGCLCKCGKKCKVLDVYLFRRHNPIRSCGCVIFRKESVCLICNKMFFQSPRKQSGGKLRLCCSAQCKKEKHTLEERTKNLRKYGWTIEDIKNELVRQNYSCYGCLERIDIKTARADHCHTNNKMRGLLCNLCNVGLGAMKDNPATMRRLMAYLDHDRSIKSIYLIGALKNPRIPEIGNHLRSRGYDVMDEWYTPGAEADTNWQAYEKQRGRTYSEALKGRAATNIFLFDRSYLDLSDIVILVMAAGKSAMIELGYAKGRGKQTYILLDGADPERYDIMPGFADKIFGTEEELLLWLEKPPSFNGEAYHV